jgi:hypothetical protein
MTQDEIMEMAREAGFKMENSAAIQAAEIFAKLVAQEVRDRIMFGSRDDWVLAEREACAEIAEKQRYAMFISLTSHPAQNGTAVGIANKIRARGEQA